MALSAKAIAARFLSANLYAVLRRVPEAWWDEAETAAAIATATGQPARTVRRRLAYLRTVGLVERRRGNTITAALEIRKVTP